MAPTWTRSCWGCKSLYAVYLLLSSFQHLATFSAECVCDPAFITLSSEVLKPSLNCLSTRIRFHWDAIESWIKPRAVEKNFFSLWGLNHSSPCVVVRPPYSRGSESQCVRRMPHFVKTLCLKWFSWSWEGFKRGWEELGEVFSVYNVFSAQQWAFLLCAFLLGGKKRRISGSHPCMVNLGRSFAFVLTLRSSDSQETKWQKIIHFPHVCEILNHKSHQATSESWFSQFDI